MFHKPDFTILPDLQILLTAETNKLKPSVEVVFNQILGDEKARGRGGVQDPWKKAGIRPRARALEKVAHINWMRTKKTIT